MTTLFYVWCAFAVATAGIALFRKFVAHHFVAHQEDDYLHVGPGQENAVNRQVEMAHRLTSIDKMGKMATTITAIYGLLLVVGFLAQAWMSDGGRVNMK